MPQSHEHITSLSKSPLLQVLTWLLLSITLFAAFARTGTKLVMVSKLKLDDHLAILATLAAVGQSIAVVVASRNGQGRHIDTLTSGQISVALKSEYAANLLFIASLVLAKLSLASSATTFGLGNHRRAILRTSICIIIWGVVGLLIVMFQCQVPAPWNYMTKSCINRTAFWTYFSVTNIVTDIALVAIMVDIFRHMQASRARKVVVIGVFGSRILMIPVIICQIVYSFTSMNSGDPTFDMWQYTVIMQVTQTLSIVTICVPAFKPFLESLESGQMSADDLRRQGKIGTNGYSSDVVDYLSGRSNNTGPGVSNHSAVSANNEQSPTVTTTVTATLPDKE